MVNFIAVKISQPRATEGEKRQRKRDKNNYLLNEQLRAIASGCLKP